MRVRLYTATSAIAVYATVPATTHLTLSSRFNDERRRERSWLGVVAAGESPAVPVHTPAGEAAKVVRCVLGTCAGLLGTAGSRVGAWQGGARGAYAACAR